MMIERTERSSEVKVDALPVLFANAICASPTTGGLKRTVAAVYSTKLTCIDAFKAYDLLIH